MKKLAWYDPIPDGDQQGSWNYFQVGGAEICVTIPTSGGLRLLVNATYVMRTMHLTSTKVT